MCIFNHIIYSIIIFEKKKKNHVTYLYIQYYKTEAFNFLLTSQKLVT